MPFLFLLLESVVTAYTPVRPLEFTFTPGALPLSTLPPVLKAIATYYVVIFGGRAVVRTLGLRPLVLNTLFQIHNLLLTSVSLAILVLMLEQLVPLIATHGLYYAICAPEAWVPQMTFLYYLNYLVKFWEFVDTFFLMVKQKKLTFLHTYHHGATALLCYTQLVGETPISWVPITLNLGVHVVMYWYYFLAARGIRVWWKEWVTRFQIIQFVLDLGFVYFATWQKIATEHAPWLPHCGDCAGGMGAAYAGCAILSLYLVLFIAFYIEVYRRKGVRSKRVKSVSGGVAARVNAYVNDGKAESVKASGVKQVKPVKRK